MTTPRRSTQRLLAAGAAVAALLAAPAVSSAATVEETLSSGPAVETYISYKAGKGEKNKLAVTVGAKSITLTDRRAKIKRKKGDLGHCKITGKGHSAVCKIDPRTPVIIDLGDQDDSVRFKGSAAADLDGTDTTQVANPSELAEPEDEDEGLPRAVIHGGAGNDVLKGSSGDDSVHGDAGKDKIYTGAGNDTIYDDRDKVADIIGAGDGVDTVKARGKTAVTIDLGLELITSGTEMTSLDAVERAFGGDGNDTLIGSDGTDGLFGAAGADMIDGAGGPDYLDCGDGADTATRGEGDVAHASCE